MAFVAVIFGILGYTFRDIYYRRQPIPSAIAFESKFILMLEGERGYVEITPGDVLNITDDRSRAEEFYFLSDESNRYVTDGCVVRLISAKAGHDRRVCVGGKDTRNATKERLQIDGSALDDTIATPLSEVDQIEAGRSRFQVKHAGPRTGKREQYIDYGDAVTFRSIYRDAFWRLDEVHAKSGDKISHAHIVAATGGIGAYDKEHTTADPAEDAVPHLIILPLQNGDGTDN